MKHPLPTLALLSLTSLAAQAQTQFRFGPQGGYTLSSATYHVADYPSYISTSGKFGSGFTAGLVAQVDLGNLFSLQPAVHYVRRTPRIDDNSYYQPNNYYYNQHYEFRLDYLSVPVNLLYSEHGHGKGFQVFAGPYLAFLLGGKYTSAISAGYGGPSNGRVFAGNVVAGDTYATSSRDTNYYSRRLDYGVQAGVGYGLPVVQLQFSFNYGLRDIGAAYAANAGNTFAAPVIHNYGFQLAASYLFGPKS
ncbi:PorT family protein [Hymenobacter sp. RP-2-7]|uniref:PorT family protein n=1 Tax=Hymenobacter polaris TaxID=2682546 RepID=A0A7Y0FMI4_9BACT|nr:porin family protein [Hymenobacter polaris]NML65444.1 PorT family protein [Hymenobacter polaris]